MKTIIDHGHEYDLLVLDGDENSSQRLTFVKREGDAFPGNSGEYPGTTLQSVIRALHSRTAFLDSQHHCKENTEIMEHLRRANWLLEKRAAKRHGLPFRFTPDEAIDAPMCSKCGHITCEDAQ